MKNAIMLGKVHLINTDVFSQVQFSFQECNLTIILNIKKRSYVMRSSILFFTYVITVCDVFIL